MFEYTAGDGSYIPASKPIAIRLLSLGMHVVILGVAFVVPLTYVSTEPPSMLAFVARAPAPPPPPPPPAVRSAPAVRPAQTRGAFAAPVAIPAAITPETGVLTGVESVGVVGGVEGGVEGGVAGGILGGLPSDVPSPPPSPVEAPKAVRVGGDIGTPTLVSRIEPEYPTIAVMAQIQGLVILEAEGDTEGRVTGVKVLRSSGILDEAAADAVRWRYSPLTLNGRAVPFIVVVTVAFRLDAPRGQQGSRATG